GSPLERYAERDRCNRLDAFSPAGQGNAHRVRRARHDAVGIVLQTLPVFGSRLEHAPLHVVGGPTSWRTLLDGGQDLLDETRDASEQPSVDDMTDPPVAEAADGRRARDAAR